MIQDFYISKVVLGFMYSYNSILSTAFADWKNVFDVIIILHDISLSIEKVKRTVTSFAIKCVLQ